MLEGSRGHVKPTFSEKSEKVLPPNEVIKVERGPKKGRKRMKEWGEVTFMKEWVKALSERSILAPADLRYLFSFPRYRNLKMHSWSIQIYNSNILPLLNAWFEACFSGPNKPLLTQCTPNGQKTSLIINLDLVFTFNRAGHDKTPKKNTHLCCSVSLHIYCLKTKV